MIRWTRSANIKWGKLTQAVQFAVGMKEFVKKYQGMPELKVFIDNFGDVGTIRWFADYENLAALEKVYEQLRADAEYLKKIEIVGDLFIEGSIYDTVMRSL